MQSSLCLGRTGAATNCYISTLLLQGYEECQVNCWQSCVAGLQILPDGKRLLHFVYQVFNLLLLRLLSTPSRRVLKPGPQVKPNPKKHRRKMMAPLLKEQSLYSPVPILPFWPVHANGTLHCSLDRQSVSFRTACFPLKLFLVHSLYATLAQRSLQALTSVL